MLLSLTTTVAPATGDPVGAFLLLLAFLLLPGIAGGFLVAWGINTLAAGLLAKGLLILGATVIGVFFYYRWFFRSLDVSPHGPGKIDEHGYKRNKRQERKSQRAWDKMYKKWQQQHQPTGAG